MAENKGDPVFGDVDELLTDKIVDHTRKHAETGGTTSNTHTPDDYFTDSDNSYEAGYSFCKPVTSSRQKLFFILLSLTILAFVLKAAFSCCNRKKHRK